MSRSVLGLQTREYPKNEGLLLLRLGDFLTAADQTAVLIPCEMFRGIVREWLSGNSAGGADYKQILIQTYGSLSHGSKVPQCDFAYNFYQMATTEAAYDPVSGEKLPSFIFRALHSTTFAPYYGATNLVRFVKIDKPDRPENTQKTKEPYSSPSYIYASTPSVRAQTFVVVLAFRTLTCNQDTDRRPQRTPEK